MRFIHVEPIQKQYPSEGNQQIAPKLVFSPISRPKHACGDCGKEWLPFNMKKPLAEPDSGRVAIRLDQLGFEKTEKRGKKNTKTPFEGYLLEQGNTS